ncbi:LD-carboxypeptidase [Candidatus Micrarchaeota archaeon]|nr:LD-carboxypeptidase [Candidatus Micrarchaeota archaeon]
MTTQKIIVPPKLKRGDGLRVIAPSDSMTDADMSKREINKAIQRLKDIGLEVSFSKNINENNLVGSSSPESRIEDLHEAFENPAVKIIMAIDGGWTTHEMLDGIDWDMITDNPKTVCGFSDMTTLLNAINAKTGLVTYYGPTFNFFGVPKSEKIEETINSFYQCLFVEGNYKIMPSEKWFDKIKTNNIKIMPSDSPAEPSSVDFVYQGKDFRNEGYWVINEGETEGGIIGGNLDTLNIIKGTEYMPNPEGRILLVEDTYYEYFLRYFNRYLQALLNLPEFKKIAGLVIGRFEKDSGITKNDLTELIKSKKELTKIPVIANVDFGHTYPLITLPIGGTVKITANTCEAEIEILNH